MSGIFDQDDPEEYGPEYVLYLIERLRPYTCADALDLNLSPALNMPGYIEQGMSQMDEYLEKHAAFEDYLREKEANNA